MSLSKDQINGIGLVVVYIILYVPALVCLSILCHRTTLALRKYKVDSEFVRILLTVTIIFLGLCVLRFLQSFLFIPWNLNQSIIALDSAINYWIPFTVMNLQYFVLTLLLYAYAKLLETTFLYEKLVPLWMEVTLYVVNGTLIVVTIVLFIIINPTGWGQYPNDPTLTDDYLFRYTYFGIALGCTLLIIPAYIIVFIKVRKESKRTTQQLVNSPRRKALKIFARKIGIFLIFIGTFFIIRFTLSFVITFITFSDELTLRILEFVWHSVPELALMYAFIAIAWRKKDTTLRGITDREEEIESSKANSVPMSEASAVDVGVGEQNQQN